MKLNHFLLVFVIIVISTVVILDIKTDNLKAAIKDKKQIDQNLDNAIDDGISSFVRVEDDSRMIVDKGSAVNSFFISLASSFGVLSDQQAKEKLNLYVPVVCVTVEDGYYIFYSDTYTGTDGKTYATKRWSEKFPYYYEDEEFIYGFTLGNQVTLYDKNCLLDPSGNQKIFIMDYHDLQNNEEYAAFRASRPNNMILSDAKYSEIKNGTLVGLIQDSMGYYTSRHNRIAAQFGITYDFALPAIDRSVWESYLSRHSMFVVFQAYPYHDGSGETYSRIATAGAKVSKVDAFYLEQKGWYLIYHRSTCLELQGDGILFLDEPFFTVKSCAKTGAYACPKCNAQGAFAPDYMPIVE
ncbi:MAG: putative rane protein [Herbinix sp.]|nr:putative rane protein [Herbinix sp.]